MKNQSARQSSWRTIGGGLTSHNEDALKAFLVENGQNEGNFNERFIKWLQFRTELTTENLPELQAAFCQQVMTEPFISRFWNHLTFFNPVGKVWRKINYVVWRLWNNMPWINQTGV